jgi:hypothetical protein
MKTVNLNDIRIDGGTQSRLVIDQTLVYQYIDCMKDGDIFPPIETMFDGSTHWLVDGFHRYHAYKLMGLKKTEVIYKPGTQEEAQVRSFGVNGKHGKPRTNEDKRNAVQLALAHNLTKDKSDREIAKVCEVSAPFVGSVRNPEVKERQQKHRNESSVKKSQKEEGVIGLHLEPEIKPESKPEFGPDEAELKANELAQQADLDMLNKLLESDEPLKLAHEELTRLNLRVAQLETRLHGLMNEKNEAVKMVKSLQKQLDKTKAKK